LIGAAIAKGLRNSGWYVTGRDIDSATQLRAQAAAAVDAVGHDHHAKVVFIAAPPHATADLVVATLTDPNRDSSTVVTDTASTKQAIVTAVADKLALCASSDQVDRYIGGHPMAGAETSGPAHTDPDIFTGATWVLTPGTRTQFSAYEVIAQAIGDLGAVVVTMDPERHDRAVALISHGPHLVAAALINATAKGYPSTRATTDTPELWRLAAGGFRDMTRITATGPSFWPEVVSHNADHVATAIDSLIAELVDVRRAVQTRDERRIAEYLTQAATHRSDLVGPALPNHITEVTLAVDDRPGVLAEVTSTASELSINIYDISIHHADSTRGRLVLTVSTQSAANLTDALLARGYHVTTTTIPGALS
jgi:prephenate dehydrogenase